MSLEPCCLCTHSSVLGTFLVNLYFFFKLDPVKVYNGIEAKGIHSLLPVSIWGSGAGAGLSNALDSNFLYSSISKALLRASSITSAASSSIVDADGAALLQLRTYAYARTLYGSENFKGLESTGAAVAIIGNTLYMGVSFISSSPSSLSSSPSQPLLVLFARFYIRSYFNKQTVSSSKTPKSHTNGKAVSAWPDAKGARS